MTWAGGRPARFLIISLSWRQEGAADASGMADDPTGGSELRYGRGSDDRDEAGRRLRPLEAVASVVVDAASRLHRDPGPGLLESV